MLDAFLEISLIAIPLAGISFALGWWGGRRQKPVPAKPIPITHSNSQADRQMYRDADVTIKALRSEITQLKNLIQNEQEKTRQAELLLELSESKQPVAMSMPVPPPSGDSSPSLPVQPTEWTILALRNRVRELEQALSERPSNK